MNYFEKYESAFHQSPSTKAWPLPIKGDVHFKKKNNNLLTPMPSKMSMSFFLQLKKIKVFDENIPGFFSI